MGKNYESPAVLRESGGFDIGSIAARGGQKNTSNNANMAQHYLMLRADGVLSASAVDATEGALLVFLASNEYTEAEMLEALRNSVTASTNTLFPLEASQREVELQQRKMIYLGYFSGEGTPKHTIEFSVKPQMKFHEGVGWSFFLYNIENSSLSGSNWGACDYFVTYFGKWLA